MEINSFFRSEVDYKSGFKTDSTIRSWQLNSFMAGFVLGVNQKETLFTGELQFWNSLLWFCLLLLN